MSLSIGIVLQTLPLALICELYHQKQNLAIANRTFGLLALRLLIVMSLLYPFRPYSNLDSLLLRLIPTRKKYRGHPSSDAPGLPTNTPLILRPRDA